MITLCLAFHDGQEVRPFWLLYIIGIYFMMVTSWSFKVYLKAVVDCNALRA